MKVKALLPIACAALLFAGTSCNSVMHSMREPNNRLDLTASDFSFSDQVSGSASSTKILTIDFNRLFGTTSGGDVGSAQGGVLGGLSVASIPVIGGRFTDNTSAFALYEMMNSNAGYDVILYPQFETRVRRPFLGLGFLYKVTDVKATARLGKLKSR